MLNGRAVQVVRTGVANTASVLAALRRAGGAPELTLDKEIIASAPLLVLPGVGAFGAAVAIIDSFGLRDILIRRIREGQATLCICLGLQLLFEASEESPDRRGLGIIPGSIVRFPRGVRVPQLGWNVVRPESHSSYIRPGHAYFANSYCAREVPAPWRVSYSEYYGRFAAACELGSVLACQFHPELSGPWGLEILRRWIERSTDSAEQAQTHTSEGIPC